MESLASCHRDRMALSPCAVKAPLAPFAPGTAGVPGALLCHQAVLCPCCLWLRYKSLACLPQLCSTEAMLYLTGLLLIPLGHMLGFCFFLWVLSLLSASSLLVLASHFCSQSQVKCLPCKIDSDSLSMEQGQQLGEEGETCPASPLVLPCLHAVPLLWRGDLYGQWEGSSVSMPSRSILVGTAFPSGVSSFLK